VVTEIERNGLTLNKKSLSAWCSQNQQYTTVLITVNGEKINQVEQFSYLGSLVTHDERCDKKIRRRIGIAKSVFRSMEKVLTTRSISMSTKLRLLKCYVWSTLLYGCEGCEGIVVIIIIVITTINTMRTRLEATELWSLRRMMRLMRISWTDKLTNGALQRSLLEVITSRQIRFLGHVLRKNELEAI